MSAERSGRSDQSSEVAFAELYHRHADAVYGLSTRLCGTESAADVTQGVFVSFWAASDRFDPQRGSLRTYLLAITQNKAIDVLRSRARRLAREQRVAPLMEHPRIDGLDVEAIKKDRADHMATAVSRLPDLEREALVVAFYGELTYKQAASLLGQPEGTTKSRIRSGLRHLAENLGDAPI